MPQFVIDISMQGILLCIDNILIILGVSLMIYIFCRTSNTEEESIPYFVIGGAILFSFIYCYIDFGISIRDGLPFSNELRLLFPWVFHCLLRFSGSFIWALHYNYKEWPYESKHSGVINFKGNSAINTLWSVLFIIFYEGILKMFYYASTGQL